MHLLWAFLPAYVVIKILKSKVSALKDLSVSQNNDNKIKVLWHPLLIKSCPLVKLMYSNMLSCTFVMAFILLPFAISTVPLSVAL